jgi:hypothetical protein
MITGGAGIVSSFVTHAGIELEQIVHRRFNLCA